MRSISFAALVAAIVCSNTVAQVPALNTVLAGSGSNGINAPIFVCAPPGDVARLFVVQKDGFIKVRTPANQAGVWTTFLNINALVSTGSEQGLLGMAFHPNYGSNGFFYVHYTDTSGNTVIRRYTVSANPDVANTATALNILTLTQPFSNHNAGWIGFGPDGYLYIPLGDGGSANDPSGNGQNINVMLGKILRIDVDGGSPYVSPPTNPYFGATPGLDQIWAIGVRNPFRCSFDRLTGDFYIGDVGQDTQEEISYQPAGVGGKNYGWRCKEGTFCTGLSGCTCTATTLTNPITTLATGATYQGIIGGYVYRGCAIPQLRGHYFFALHETALGKIWTLTHNGTTSTVVDRTADLAPSGGGSIVSIVSFGEDGNGELYICDINGDEVWKIVPQVPQLVGVTSYGTGTPGCSGPSVLSLACSPTLFNPGETINSTNGPPGSNLIGIVGSASLPPGSDPLFIAVETLVNLTPGTHFLYNFTVAGNGTAAVPAFIPNVPAIVGFTFYVQHFFVWASCSPSPLNLSATQALAITIQP